MLNRRLLWLSFCIGICALPCSAQQSDAVVIDPPSDQVINQLGTSTLTVAGSGNFSASNVTLGTGTITSTPGSDLLLQSGSSGVTTFDVWSNNSVYGNGGAVSILLPGTGSGDVMISDADSQVTFFCADTNNDYVGVGAPAVGQSLSPVLPGRGTAWQPGCAPPLDVFDVSNRETFGNGYMHWFTAPQSGLGSPSLQPASWDAGISNPTSGLLSFDTSVDGDGAGTIQVGKILFLDGSSQTTASSGSGPAGNTFTGSVGIGTNTPQAALDIEALGAAGSPIGVRLVNTLPTPESSALTEVSFGSGAHPNGLAMIEAGGTDLNAGNGFIAIQTASSGTLTERMRISPTGFVGIGTSAPTSALEINGQLTLTAGQGGSIAFQDSSVQSTAWNGTTFGGDYAEAVDVNNADDTYQAGDVIVIDVAHPGKFTKSAKPFSKLVAGVYSTKPGLVGKRQTGPKSSPDAIPMAMIGIVPTKATSENGPIRVGDLLVSSSAAGRVMRAGDGAVPAGTVIGKALSELNPETGTVEALITLQ